MSLNHSEYKETALKYFCDVSESKYHELFEAAKADICNRVISCEQLEHIENTNTWEVLHDELEQSVQNLTFSLLQYHVDHQNYFGRYKNIFEFVNAFKMKDYFFEQSVTLGHATHPMTKTKLGLTPKEVLRYAPEFRNNVEVIPLLCRKEDVVSHGVNTIPKSFTAQLQAHMEQHQLNIDDYALIWVHEWQYEHYLKQHQELLIDTGIVLPIPSLKVSGKPLLSFRTLYVPAFDCVIKTAVNVQATSAVRNVSMASVTNGMLLSDYVSKIFERDYPNCFIQKDLGGASLNIEPHQNKLSCIYRESIPVESNQYAMVAASLITKSFITDQFIIFEAIEMIMAHQGIDFETAALKFFESYTSLLIDATYRLMIEHQISLEAHMQNTSIVLEQGMPARIYIRDFGGVRIKNSSIPVDNTTGLLTDSFQDLLNVFTHAVLYNHLFLIIDVLGEHIDRTELYEVIRKYIQHINMLMTPEIDVLQMDRLPIKSLLKMRLFDDGYSYQYATIRNPLKSEGEVCGKQ